MSMSHMIFAVRMGSAVLKLMVIMAKSMFVIKLGHVDSHEP